MKMQIKEFAKLTNVSVRTLQYYDEIGLLKPCCVDEQNGYRYYDDASLLKMQEILFYRELDFPLKSIIEILSSPNYDKKRALAQQKHLLMLKKERLTKLISALESAEKGEITMDIFDNSEFETAKSKYADEVKQRWGDTDAYKQSCEKTKAYNDDKWSEINIGMNDLMAEFADCLNNGEKPSGDKAQNLVKRWQDYISDNYYDCKIEILSGLGAMYVADERFMKNIDRHGKGTAQFMADAIKCYCEK